MFGNQNKWKKWIWGVAILLVVSGGVIHAQSLDTDYDSISDVEEVGIETNPENPDTDGDGVSDGVEKEEGTNPLDEKSSMLSGSEIKIKYAWYLGRASGIVAFVLFSIVVIYGLLMSTSLSAKLGIVSSYEVHRFFSWTALLSTVVHFSSFFFDDFLRLKPVEVFVPFLFERNFGSVGGYDFLLPIAFGVTAFYLAVLISVTAEFRTKIAPKAWRKIHYASFAFYLMMVGHGFFAGSDSGEWWMRTMYIISITLVFFLLSFRILKKPATEGIVPVDKKSELEGKNFDFRPGNAVEKY